MRTNIRCTTFPTFLWILCLSLALGLCCLFPAPGSARLIFDTADPAFAGATVETFDGLGLVTGEKSFTFTTSGVTFMLSIPASSSIGGLTGCNDSAGGCHLVLGLGQGPITIAIVPPVAAIGLQLRSIDGPAKVTFTGALGSEQFEPRQRSFIGAADIGDIFTVLIENPFSTWDDLRFVPGSGGIPQGQADLSLSKSVALGSFRGGAPILYDITVTNHGPDTAKAVQFIDFLPPDSSFLGSTLGAVVNAAGTLVTVSQGDLPNQTSVISPFETMTPPFDALRGSACNSNLVNIAVATSSSSETNPGNNLAITVTPFDKSSRARFAEICGNGRDDNCDGLVDCGDPACGCVPPPPLVGGPPECVSVPGPLSIPVQLALGLLAVPQCAPQSRPASTYSCTGELHGFPITLPLLCCDPDTVHITPEQELERRIAQCNPHDPNFKEVSPPVNPFGYGYTQAGLTMTYVVHYENTGGTDAHNVRIIDVLSADLDDTTLVVNDGGTYDPATRALVWQDPLVPPATPRSVSLSVAVRSDASEGTRIRNVGIVVFPDAVPPERTDTNFVEHLVIDPSHLPVADLKVSGCTQIQPGQWQVHLVNEGFAFAYNVTATIVHPPDSVQVTDPTASFGHPDDVLDTSPHPRSTVIALATTPSTDTVAFTTQVPGDPCDALTWHIQYQNFQGEVFTRDVQADRAPVAQCQDVSATAGATCLASTSVNSGSFDPDGDAVTLVQSPSGPYGLGATQVTLTATDPGGQSSSCQATVTVVDITPPAIMCPAPETVECTSSTGANVTVTATASDNCSMASVACSPDSGTFRVGSMPVICTATDASGNKSRCQTTVTVVDTKPPKVECVPVGRPQSQREDDDHDRGASSGFFKVSAQDLCSPTVAITIGSFQLTNGDTIRIKQTQKPGVRMQKSKPGEVPIFEVGPRQNVIEGTDSAGNMASATCLIPSAPKERDDDRERERE